MIQTLSILSAICVPCRSAEQQHLGMKLLAVASIGLSLHLIWRWRSTRKFSRQAAPRGQEGGERQPVLKNTEEEEEQRDKQRQHHEINNASDKIIITGIVQDRSTPYPSTQLQEESEQQENSAATEETTSIPLFSRFIGEHANNSSDVPLSSPTSIRKQKIPSSSPFFEFGEDAGRHITPANLTVAQTLSQQQKTTDQPDFTFEQWSALVEENQSSAQSLQRSFTLHSTTSERRLPRVNEEEHVDTLHDDERSQGDEIASHRNNFVADNEERRNTSEDVRLALKLDVISGPRTRAHYVTGENTTNVIIGRAPDNDFVIPDGEVSGHHINISWSRTQHCWQVRDMGSLNGTQLNGESISSSAHDTTIRNQFSFHRLCTDDIIQLGSVSKLKVSVFPREMLPENSIDRSLSLSLGGPSSLPRSLTMPKHRIPSFSSLLTPKINSPSKQAVVAAASDELRLECCIASATGRDHARKGQVCEDIALAECPLHGSDTALFCVFDGHCGRGAANAASIILPDEVSDRLQTSEGIHGLTSGQGVESILRDAFLATDKRIDSEEGSTATAVLAWRGFSNGSVMIQAANVGDSAALLIDPQTGSWRVLTEDHRLTNPAERERLAQNGIPIHSDSRRLYGLNLARALGDKFLKDEDLGLSAEPAVSPVVELSLDQGALLIIASDGLWDVMDPEKVAQSAVSFDREQDGSVVEIAGAIVNAAKKAGTRDDVTALVLRIWPAEEWEVRSPLMNLDDGKAASFEA